MIDAQQGLKGRGGVFTTTTSEVSRLATPTFSRAVPPSRVHDTTHHGALSLLRATGALGILAMGAVHLQQYLHAYSSVPTIGTLFVLNFAGAVIIGVGLLLPIQRGRAGTTGVALLAIAGVGMAATSIVFLLISEHTSLFGFMETGYGTPILVALISEGIAVLLLGAYLLTLRSGPGRRA
jgi:hypothetical protein